MIVTVGEVVWDCFPDRQVLGGAPVNVACHLVRLGTETLVVTRVGADDLGRRTLDALSAAGLDLAGIQEDEELPTGRVNVTFDEKGEPHFEIMAPAAWDGIAFDPAATVIAGRPYGLVFGTLAQRDGRSRATIERLIDGARRRYYDVNLRPPFTPVERVAASLARAEVVKLNEEELAVLGRELALGDPEADLRQTVALLRERFGIDIVVVTAGARGAWLVDDEGTVATSGVPVSVADPVGAGDAFFAAFIDAAERGLPRAVCLERANRLGALVASLPGATPAIDRLPWERS